MRKAAGVALCLAALGGCSSQHGSPSTPPQTTTTTAGAASTSAAASTTLSASVVGFGATDAVWEAHHRRDPAPGFTPGAVYDPDPTLPLVNGHVADRYYVVMHQYGHVLGYSIDLHPGTTIAAARATVLQEFPNDAATAWFAEKDTCAQMEVNSALLGSALADRRIGDSAGGVLAEFGTLAPDGTTAYDRQSITEVILMLGGSYPTAQSSPGC